jgi:Homeodomain-like domain/Integrase core domain
MNFLHPLLVFLASLTQQELARQVMFLREENRILRSRLPGRVIATPAEKSRLIKLGRDLGVKLRDMISIVSDSTFRRWIRDAEAAHVDREQSPRSTGRPRTASDIRELVVKLATENRWGYTLILGALRKLGIESISRSTVKAILKEHHIAPAPDRPFEVALLGHGRHRRHGERGVCRRSREILDIDHATPHVSPLRFQTGHFPWTPCLPCPNSETSKDRPRGSWSEFIRIHAATLVQCDLLSKPVWTPKGLVTLYVLAFIHIGSRRLWLSPSTRHPDAAWVTQQAKRFQQHAMIADLPLTILLRDNDVKYPPAFDEVFRNAGIKVPKMPPSAPNLRAHVERVIQTIQSEVLDSLIVTGERHFNHILTTTQNWYNAERSHSARDHLPTQLGQTAAGGQHCHPQRDRLHHPPRRTAEFVLATSRVKRINRSPCPIRNALIAKAPRPVRTVIAVHGETPAARSKMTR